MENGQHIIQLFCLWYLPYHQSHGWHPRHLCPIITSVPRPFITSPTHSLLPTPAYSLPLFHHYLHFHLWVMMTCYQPLPIHSTSISALHLHSHLLSTASTPHLSSRITSSPRFSPIMVSPLHLSIIILPLFLAQAPNVPLVHTSSELCCFQLHNHWKHFHTLALLT